jgi:hypothetical protein
MTVAYDSAGGNGWMGLGWDLGLPAVTIDTRWGVPRYSASQETETYTLNGDQLTPVAHRAALQPRAAEKVFHTRVEGQFQRIVRHGTSPGNYTWEITDKAGTTWRYGSAGGGPAADATLADDAGNVFLWALVEARDPLDEPEGRRQPGDRRTHVGIDQDGDDRCRRDRAVGLHAASLDRGIVSMPASSPIHDDQIRPGERTGSGFAVR